VPQPLYERGAEITAIAAHGDWTATIWVAGLTPVHAALEPAGGEVIEGLPGS
jgi:hypothetical protein